MHRFPSLHQALDFVADAHNGQLRKGTAIPYLAHLLGVCSLVLDYGGDEDQAIAGLLHDVIEDCDVSASVIREKFGDRVARIVLGCTDGTPGADGSKAPWMERKETYLHHLRDADEDTLLVSACDKLHNARAIGADVRVSGVAVYERFKAGRDGTLWYYQELLKVFAARMGNANPLVIELTAAVSELGV